MWQLFVYFDSGAFCLLVFHYRMHLVALLIGFAPPLYVRIFFRQQSEMDFGGFWNLSVSKQSGWLNRLLNKQPKDTTVGSPDR